MRAAARRDKAGKTVKRQVVVTGGTGGIGEALAHALHASGFIPVIGHRASGEAKALAIAKACGGVRLLLDMADNATIDAACAALGKDGNPVAGLVLAASPPPRLCSFGQISPEDHHLFWSVNVAGPQRLLAGMVQNCFRPHKAGSVVAVLSEAMGGPATGAMRGMGAYTISKFGLQGVMALLKAEYPWLKTASVSPGFTDTAMLAAFDPRFVEQLRMKEALASAGGAASRIMRELALD